MPLFFIKSTNKILVIESVKVLKFDIAYYSESVLHSFNLAAKTQEFIVQAKQLKDLL